MPDHDGAGAGGASGLRAPRGCGGAVLLLLLASRRGATAFYLPGVAPQDYATGDAVNVKVSKLSSTKTQARARAVFSSQTRPHAALPSPRLLPPAAVRVLLAALLQAA